MRYTKYALGEMVLVVVGILIALQINDWYQERQDRQTEAKYLFSMKRDMTEDARELRVASDGNNHLLAGLNRTLRLLAEPRDDDMLYYRTALNILTQMYKRQSQLAEALEALLKEQYGI
jgi:hypothetical protein